MCFEPGWHLNYLLLWTNSKSGNLLKKPNWNENMSRAPVLTKKEHIIVRTTRATTISEGLKDLKISTESMSKDLTSRALQDTTNYIRKGDWWHKRSYWMVPERGSDRSELPTHRISICAKRSLIFVTCSESNHGNESTNNLPTFFKCRGVETYSSCNSISRLGKNERRRWVFYRWYHLDQILLEKKQMPWISS